MQHPVEHAWPSRRSRRALLVVMAGALLAACAYDDDLGAPELLFVSSPQMAKLAGPVWRDAIRRAPSVADETVLVRVGEIARRVGAAARIDTSQWVVTVVEDDDLNAVALPNRKIIVTSGLAAFAQNDAQLAAAVALGLAHVNYNHYGERYTQSPLASAGLVSTQIAEAGRREPGRVKALFALAESPEAAAPFSREHVLSADRYAVRYLERAGYDPHAALTLWRRLAAAGAQAPSMLLATHPVDATRLTRLREEIDLMRLRPSGRSGAGDGPPAPQKLPFVNEFR